MTDSPHSDPTDDNGALRPEVLPDLLDQHEHLVTMQRRVLLAGVVVLVALNMVVAAVSARTLHVLGEAIAAGPDNTDRVLLVIDCRRQADLERLATQLDLDVDLVDPRCAELRDRLQPGQ